MNADTHGDVDEKLLVTVTAKPLVSSPLEEISDRVARVLIEAGDLRCVDHGVEQSLEAPAG